MAVWRSRAKGACALVLVSLARVSQGQSVASAPATGCVADPALPSFEAVAITPTAEKDRGNVSIGSYGSPRFTFRNVPLSLLIAFAYKVQSGNFTGATKGLDDAVFSVEIKTADDLPLTYELLKPRMLQMLEQRFCLKAQAGTKQVAGYALTVAKAGPKLTPSKATEEQNTDYILKHEVRAVRVTPATIASMLASPVGKPVEDHTGLTGNYDAKVQFSSPTDTDADLPSIFTAVREQLGLELKPAQVPVPTLTIEHVNLTPSEN